MTEVMYGFLQKLQKLLDLIGEMDISFLLLNHEKNKKKKVEIFSSVFQK